ncbi:glycoside hydrolase family 88 protein [Parabacteroides sp. PF5-6]|uniref:glycoside hydrolase family 88 protein n=1 Tax=Parabacteroides sp. PF5-6 TaxID=1742403 RepID=UPI002405DB3D|nr:glycoside hydrolase family 88 protein [Parabacteroides sp. PF5-6]MDF9831147.1 rhamnogalacturonyl hydrolase YesR [Parabacteroides sp. PF5-6]
MMKSTTALVLSLLFFACAEKKETDTDFIRENVAFACDQIGREIDVIEKNSEKFLNPTTLKADGSVFYCGYADWRSGFFPGSIWYLYELTGDEAYRPLAEKYCAAIEEAKNLTWHHDVGFMIGCSFGNGLRLTGNPQYKEVVVQAARSLSTRFRPEAGIIQSWDVDRGWMSQRGWECPVIIDNMMNLELMFEATKITDDPSFREIALAHADRTLTEQFRADGSCYHVIDYSLEDGSVRNRHTAQGYAHESAWSRGQAWAIYGYTICYRETGEQKYLDQALKTFRFMRDHKDMPDDLIPYWDMDAPDIPNALRDVSSASCIASALYEISTLDLPEADTYKTYADQIMRSLASPAYRAEPGTNGNFLLMHSVGSIPHDAEVDKPLNYADYYFLEALKRKKDIEEAIL